MYSNSPALLSCANNSSDPLCHSPQYIVSYHFITAVGSICFWMQNYTVIKKIENITLFMHSACGNSTIIMLLIKT